MRSVPSWQAGSDVNICLGEDRLSASRMAQRLCVFTHQTNRLNPLILQRESRLNFSRFFHY